MSIDYFSRKLFARAINNKEGFKIVEFLEKLWQKIPFRSMISDNGREFDNSLGKEWNIKNIVKHYFSVAYDHQSNGRIERANRTIGNALKKCKAATKDNFGKLSKTTMK